MEIIYSNDSNFNDLIKNGNVLVDFYANWCGPCKMLNPELEKIKDIVQIIKVNVDENHNLCKKYGVMTIPTLIYFNEKGYKSRVGFMKSEEILNFIK